MFIDDKNIALEGTVSHFSDLGPSFYLCEKTGNFYSIFKTIFFSKYHKTKTKTYIKNRRHGSLHPDLKYMLLKFH